jgi:GNAT superfamily N-acetyltransferase
MNIRRATREDAFRIASIHVDSWKDAYRDIIPRDYIDRITHQARLTHWERVLATGNLPVYVYVDEAAGVQGWVAAGRDREQPDDVTVAEIEAMYVDPAHTRHGVGCQLLSHVVPILAAAGASRITVWVLERNEPAVCFYRKVGFHPVPVNTTVIERGGMELVELKLEMRVIDQVQQLY